MTRSREAHPAGKRRSPRARADDAYLDAWTAVEREQARTWVWRRRYWQAATVVIFGTGLLLWAYGLALIWSVAR
jgi:hypothetical protein